MLTVIAIVLAILVLPSPWGAVAVVCAAVVDVAETGAFLWWTRRRRPTVGVETFMGREATVVRATDPVGQVALDGELWTARSDVAHAPGSRVVVRSVEGLTLTVEGPSGGSGVTESRP